ncbi:(deoxy)nucleoside triphosphate pyrophosphohydrolase [Micromonospora sp. HM5-17]|jgi:8-oxo-dGTP diphosphatase|uniref:(deoxy)nucleoside triphosphate pyrophosphohydrolase n=1 Tax=Micromonospora sp. HM5-17 TaxID=2487710 RepID=UPI000F4AA86F|nr:(deoxy)nucleoside triphosphate pyrophosphohydrolase [Micromonospora sp. HM5-17]ROT32172.1 (deoxy)nucleoside triphosphate pyrophosphohydrolase [Micromonospora sp. HM5-17]
MVVRSERVSGRDRTAPNGGLSDRNQHQPRVVVGAAIIAGDRVLGCARSGPPEVAGRWEFPGGKVEPGESEEAALIRECAEELGVRVQIGDRVGGDVPMGHGRSVLRVYLARLVGDDEPKPLEHAELRWMRAEELDSVPWLPADVPIVLALRPVLAARCG